MKIYFHGEGHRPEPWLSALREALAEAGIAAEVALWTPGAPPGDYALVWAPPQRLLDEQTGLKALFNLGAGVDAILQLRLPAGLRLVRLDDAGMSAQMAEYVLHALVRHFREFDAYEADTRQGRWSFRRPRARQDCPVGILGLGVLGQRVARAVQGLDFPVRGWSRSPRHADDLGLTGLQCYAGREGLPAFLAASKVLVCLLPLTAETQGILNRVTLSQLMPGGYLINVARGGHLVEEDLIPLIDSGQLAGATLDVFRQEPLPAGHPFWTHPKITVTPHTAARTLRDGSVAQIVGKIARLERGEAVAGVVDPARGY
jgi:glyoxylate/hydroxypyruvate reductase A